MWSDISCPLLLFLIHNTKQLPLFPGEAEIDQIYRIFRLRGTPTSEVWPEYKTLPCYRHAFPKWRAKALQQELNTNETTTTLLEVSGKGGWGGGCCAICDLTIIACPFTQQGLLTYDPEQRMSALEALRHPYFDDVRDGGSAAASS